jgi:hypothetical protein
MLNFPLSGRDPTFSLPKLNTGSSHLSQIGASLFQPVHRNPQKHFSWAVDDPSHPQEDSPAIPPSQRKNLMYHGFPNTFKDLNTQSLSALASPTYIPPSRRAPPPTLEMLSAMNSFGNNGTSNIQSNTTNTTRDVINSMHAQPSSIRSRVERRQMSHVLSQQNAMLNNLGNIVDNGPEKLENNTRKLFQKLDRLRQQADMAQQVFEMEQDIAKGQQEFWKYAKAHSIKDPFLVSPANPFLPLIDSPQRKYGKKTRSVEMGLSPYFNLSPSPGRKDKESLMQSSADDSDRVSEESSDEGEDSSHDDDDKKKKKKK